MPGIGRWAGRTAGAYRRYSTVASSSACMMPTASAHSAARPMSKAASIAGSALPAGPSRLRAGSCTDRRYTSAARWPSTVAYSSSASPGVPRGTTNSDTPPLSPASPAVRADTSKYRPILHAGPPPCDRRADSPRRRAVPECAPTAYRSAHRARSAPRSRCAPLTPWRAAVRRRAPRRHTREQRSRDHGAAQDRLEQQARPAGVHQRQCFERTVAEAAERRRHVDGRAHRVPPIPATPPDPSRRPDRLMARKRSKRVLLGEEALAPRRGAAAVRR